MKPYLIFFTVVVGLSFVLTDQSIETKKVNIKNNETIKTSKPTNLNGTKSSAAQKRIGQGYSYSKPERFTTGNGADRHRFQSKPYRQRGRNNPKQSTQVTPFTTYGVPKPSQPLIQKPSVNKQPQQYNYDENYNEPMNYYKQTESPNFLRNPDIQSIMNNVGSEKPSPIASQNSIPFGTHTANYLPPKNQRLPVYTEQTFQNYQTQSQSPASIVGGHRFNYINQNGNSIQSGFQTHQISDATQFLEQNAQAIANLYSAPATNENFAPMNDEIPEDIPNSLSQNTLQNYQFRGSLPAYASGVGNYQQLPDNIQPQDNDRMIAHLQQSHSAQQDSSGRYDRNYNYYQQESVQPIFATQYPIGDKSNSEVDGNEYYNQYLASHFNRVPETIYGQAVTHVPAPAVTQPTPIPSVSIPKPIESTPLFNPVGHYGFSQYANFGPSAYEAQVPTFGINTPNFASINSLNKPIAVQLQTPTFKPSVTIPSTSTHLLTVPSFPTEFPTASPSFELPIPGGSVSSLLRPGHSYQPSLYPTTAFGSNHVPSVTITSPLNPTANSPHSLLYSNYEIAPTGFNSLYKANAGLPIYLDQNLRRRSHKKRLTVRKYSNIDS